MAMIGSGAQAEFQALAMKAVVGIDHVRLYDIDPQATGKAIDPLSALVYVKAGEELAQLYRADDAVTLYRKGVAIDPKDRDAQFDLGMALLRTGDEAGAKTTVLVARPNGGR